MFASGDHARFSDHLTHRIHAPIPKKCRFSRFIYPLTKEKSLKTMLLDRLHPENGYLAVSYFIVAVLMRIGALSEALHKAQHDLPVGERHAFGLSNILMLLNGLLKYRHPDFTNQMLDDIERTIHGLNEHPFLIPAKLAAIRTARLSKIKK